MAIWPEGDRSRRVVEIEPELHHEVEAAAARHGVAVKKYVAVALRHALGESESDRATATADPWSTLSHRSFARDWESEADAVYDDPA